jgi:signal transduction histidine kinase
MNDHGSMSQIESSAAAQPMVAELQATAASHRPWRALGLSLLLLASLTAIKLVWAKQIGNAPPYLLYFAVILVGSWYGGLRIGLLLTGVSALFANLLFAASAPPLSSAPGVLRLVTFLAEGAAISALAAYAQLSRTRTAAAAQRAELSLAKLRSVLGAVADGITVQDADGRLIYANGPAAELSGFASADELLRASPEQILQRFDLFGADGQPFPPAELPGRLALRGEASPECSIRFRVRATGEERWALVRANPVYLAGAAAPFAVNAFRDVTEQREDERRRAFIASATAELASSLDYTKTLVTLARLAVPDMADFCAVDIREASGWRRLAIQHIDPTRLERLLELERLEPGDPSRSSLRMDVLQSGEPVYFPEMRDSMLDAAAEARAHLESLRAIGLGSFIGVPLHVHGELMGVISLALCRGKRGYQSDDLQLATELADRAGLAVSNARLFARAEAARRDAEQANRAKDEFLAMLGHELRNPLAPIVTALQLMKLRAADVFDKERSIVERQVRHMVTLVDDLLDVSRITRGKVELNREPVELIATVHKALELAGPLIEQRQHTVDVAVNGTLRVLGDTVRLAQVVSNLLTNAAKYTPPRGHIWISASVQGGEVTLTVRDDGVGIEPELLPRMFDLFVQGGQALDRSQGGLGLGLTIVRSVVELHGGRVLAHSEGRGKGSEFSFSLPLLGGAAAARLVSENRPQPTAAKVKGARILIVDDNLDALALLSEALQLVGYETHEAEDAAGAIATAQTIMPQLALLDIGLPVMNGYELARRLRAIPGLEQIKLAALTGYGQPSDKERTREAGFDEHLVKPIAIERVQQVVARLLQA